MKSGIVARDEGGTETRTELTWACQVIGTRLGELATDLERTDASRVDVERLRAMASLSAHVAAEEADIFATGTLPTLGEIVCEIGNEIGDLARHLLGAGGVADVTRFVDNLSAHFDHMARLAGLLVFFGGPLA